MRNHGFIAALLVLAANVALVACDRSSSPPLPSGGVTAAKPRPSPWRLREGSQQAAVPSDVENPALAAAIEHARATADEARMRWSAAPPDQRSRWAVKWAAPTESGGVEHVWVRPSNWSTFRIEGVLDSPPQSPLACGKSAGELVGFPIEELTDWIYAVDGDFAGRREGGFTIDAIERQNAGRTNTP